MEKEEQITLKFYIQANIYDGKLVTESYMATLRKCSEATTTLIIRGTIRSPFLYMLSCSNYCVVTLFAKFRG